MLLTKFSRLVVAEIFVENRNTYCQGHKKHHTLLLQIREGYTTLPLKSLNPPASSWSKTTPNAGSVGGAGTDPKLVT